MITRVRRSGRAWLAVPVILFVSGIPVAWADQIQGTIGLAGPTGGAGAAGPASLMPAALSPICGGTDFCLPPSVTTSTPVNSYKLDLVVGCLNLSTGSVVPFCNVVLTLQATAFSGGHEHDDSSRPTGTIVPSSGNTGPSGALPVTYTSPEISGVVTLTLTGTAPDGSAVIPVSATFGIETPGFVALPTQGPGFAVVPSALHDLNNLYVTSTVQKRLESLPGRFQTELLAQGVPSDQIPILAYTSMSLPAGGLFDIGGDWGPPHASHRFGLDADLRIRNIPRKYRDELEDSILKLGLFFPSLDESPANPDATHWHLRSRQ